MTLEQQLSKVRLFQTEVSMLRTRILDTADEIECSRASFLRLAAENLQDAQKKLQLDAHWIASLCEKP